MVVILGFVDSTAADCHRRPAVAWDVRAVARRRAEGRMERRQYLANDGAVVNIVLAELVVDGRN
jgi:hypothetical protein